MQCNALNIKTVTEQVWLYFICGTMWPRYMGNPYLYQATQKNTCPNFHTQKNPEIEIFKTQKNPSIIPVT